MVDLLLAALDATGERRLSHYREALAGVDDLGELVVLVAQLNREDLDEGHIAVLAALVGGAAAIPELGPKVAVRLEPWLRFSEERIAAVLDGSPLETLVPAKDLAFAICALFLGVEMLSQLESDVAPAESLFVAAERVTRLFAPFLGVSQ